MTISSFNNSAIQPFNQFLIPNFQLIRLTILLFNGKDLIYRFAMQDRIGQRCKNGSDLILSINKKDRPWIAGPLLAFQIKINVHISTYG